MRSRTSPPELLNHGGTEARREQGAAWFERRRASQDRLHGLLRVLAALALLGVLAPRGAFAQGTGEAGAAEPDRRAARAAAAYKPMGAPADAAVDVRWNRYHDHAAATEIMRALVEAYPRLNRLESLGKSHGGREMWLWTITNGDTGPDTEKPAFYIDGGIHANELQGPEVALYTGWFLLEMYGRNELVTRLLDERAFYLVPIMSPDSRDAHMHEPNTTHSPRGGTRPVDDDLDGLVDEDGFDDLDGDGSITSMRVRDPHGRLKPHEQYPDLMVEAGPEEVGGYTMLGWEGIDSDGDGRVNEDGPGAYDPNRDWAWRWEPRYVQWGAHRYPFSIGENRLVAEFVMTRPNIAGAQSYHNAGGMILRSPGVKGEPIPRADRRVFDVIGNTGEAMLPGYRYLDVADGLYEVFGGEFDWFYNMRGALTFTNELFTSFNLFREKSEGGFFGSREDLHRFDRYLLLGEGVVGWREVDHPTYGRVEVGGLRKEWLRQPPSFLLEEECHRNMAFSLYHADQMPLVEIAAVERLPLRAGVEQITATITNPKVIPTRLAVDVERGLFRPDVVRLSGAAGGAGSDGSDGSDAPGVSGRLEVLAALVSEDPFFRDPRSVRIQPDKRDPREVRLDTVPGMGSVYVRWIVRGASEAGPLTVTVRSLKGGQDSLP